MEHPTRKCVCCRNLLQESYYNGALKTCISSLEKAKIRYREDTENIPRRCKLYRDSSIKRNIKT